MLIKIDETDKYICPTMTRSREQPIMCYGQECALWRFADVRKTVGYCGLGSLPLEVDG